MGSIRFASYGPHCVYLINVRHRADDERCRTQDLEIIDSGREDDIKGVSLQFTQIRNFFAKDIKSSKLDLAWLGLKESYLMLIILN